MPVQSGPVTFEHADGVFVRDGECSRCGECCESGDPFNGEEGESVVAGACPLFRRLPDGLGHCSNREHSYYLNGCAHWPSHPAQIVGYPSCTYTFRRVEVQPQAESVQPGAEPLS